MANIYDMSDTWNDGGTTFTAIKMDVTDTASAADSLLMDLQVGGSSKFKVDKNGEPYFGTLRIRLFDNSLVNWAGTSYASFKTGSFIAIGQIFTNANLSINGVILDDDAANTLAQRNSTNAQTFNLYNTYTDASNYERGFMKWNSNVLEIGTEAAGTGTARDLRLIASNVLLGTNSAPAVKSDTTQAGANSVAASNVVTISQADYDALTPDADTIYFIV